MIKKLLFKVVIVVAVMLLVPYYLLGGSGPGFLKGLFSPAQKSGPAISNMSSVTTDKPVTLYKCVGSSGELEYSQSPCDGGEQIQLKPNVNVVDRTRIPENEAASESGGVISLLGGGDKAGGDKKDGELDIGNPYDPDNVKKLVKDAQNINKMMEQHNKNLESIGN